MGDSDRGSWTTSLLYFIRMRTAIAAEIIENLEAGLNSFREIMNALGNNTTA